MQSTGSSNVGDGGARGDTSASSSQTLPVIEADPRTNSVLIRDVPQRLAQYQSLIDTLDVRPRLIEIEAHIISIEDSALEQLGVDWRAQNSHIDIQTGNGTTRQNGYDANIDPPVGTQPLWDGGGGAFTAVLGNAGRYLLARVNALHKTNLAKIDASPKVATLNNVEAVMDQKARFFVRVAGYASADMYSVSSGVSLRVLPLVVEENGRTDIKLNVHIEDGEITSQRVDAIPVITTSTINTESFVRQGESLLIAGYRADTSTNGETSVPVLRGSRSSAHCSAIATTSTVIWSGSFCCHLASSSSRCGSVKFAKRISFWERRYTAIGRMTEAATSLTRAAHDTVARRTSLHTSNWLRVSVEAIWRRI